MSSNKMNFLWYTSPAIIYQSPLILLLVSLGEAVILRATYVCVLQCNLCKAGQADVNLVTNPKLNDFHSMLDGRMKRSNATATMTQLVDSIGRQNADTMV